MWPGRDAPKRPRGDIDVDVHPFHHRREVADTAVAFIRRFVQ